MAIDNPSQDVELRLEVIARLRDAIRDLGDLNDNIGTTDKNLDKLTRDASKAISQFDGLGKSAKSAGSELRRAADVGTSEWSQGTEELRKLNAEYRAFRQQAAVGGAPVANPLASLSQASKSRLIGIADAESASAIRVLREEADKASGAFGRLSDSELPRLRYALYDVASTANITALAITGLGVATFAASASFESAFTNVERTLDPAYQGVSQLREELLQMSRESPKSFVDLSEIATLSNQLGVAGDDVAGFTDVVAKFSTVSGMTAEASALAFGRLTNILQYPLKDVNKLASAIELVGISSAATDQEIIALAQRLGATATRAGFTADQVVGLAGALGSLGVAPERAQGVFETYFNSLNESLTEGGKKLEAFSAITGTTVDELQTLVRTGEGFQVFQKFLSGLQGADTVQLTDALSTLGLNGLRANEVIGRISQNLPLLQQAFAVAAKGAAEGNELNRQYALILDDLSSKWQILVNAVLEFASAVGTAVAPAAKAFLDIVTDLLHSLTDFINTPIGQSLAQSAAAFAVLVAAVAGTTGGLAIFGASLAAVRTAIVALGLESFIARLGGVSGALLGVSGASFAAASGLGKVALSLLAIGRATVIIGVIQLLFMALTDLRGTMNLLIDASENLANVGLNPVYNQLRLVYATVSGLIAVFNGLTGATLTTGEALGRSFNAVTGVFEGLNAAASIGVQAVIGWANGVEAAVKILVGRLAKPIRDILNMLSLAGQYAANALGPVADVLGSFGSGFSKGFDEFGSSMKKGFDSLRDWADTLPSMNDALLNADGLGSELSPTMDDLASSFDDVGTSAAGAAEQVRTLADYASDLQGVFSRAFEIRYGGMQAFDAITTGWNAIRDAADQAAKAARDHQNTLAGLSADRSIKEYWLSVAEMYGDELRAAKLRADLADINAKVADTSQDLAKEQQKSSKTLSGNTDAAIANRASLLGLVGNYSSYLQALAASGASQAELQAASARLKQEFIAQATQMGFNRGEVEQYAASFDDMSLAISRIPRNVTVEANVNPALQALAEFEARAAAAARNAANSINTGGGLGYRPQIGDMTGAGEAAGKSFKIGFTRGSNGAFLYGDGTGSFSGKAGELKFFDKGGYTGSAPTNKVTGAVHGQEYVFSAPAVRNMGVGTLNNLHQAAKSGRPFMSGSAGPGGPTGPLDLTPGTIQALAAAVAPVLLLDGQRITSNVGMHNASSTALGAS